LLGLKSASGSPKSEVCETLYGGVFARSRTMGFQPDRERVSEKGRGGSDQWSSLCERYARAVYGERESAEQLARTGSRVRSSKDGGARRGRRVAVEGWRRAVVEEGRS
jgi:hypothetical protein